MLERTSITKRPPKEYVFLYFLRDLNSKIAIMIQCMHDTTLPIDYGIIVAMKNSLIHASRIAPMLPIFIFPKIQASTNFLTLQIVMLPPSPIVAATSSCPLFLALDFQKIKES